MDAKKYNRDIPMMCPTCGGTQFETNDSATLAKCVRCELEITIEALKRSNERNIELHVEEVKDQIIKDIKKDVSKMFKKFR